MHFATTTTTTALFFLAATALAYPDNPFFSSNPKLRILDRRQGGQAFIPDQVNLDGCTGIWAYCDPTHCYQPARGDVCCSEGYACPGGNGGSYCLTQGYCCPNGTPLAECAANNGVTLSSGFKTDAVTPTYTPPGTGATTAAASTTATAVTETETPVTTTALVVVATGTGGVTATGGNGTFTVTGSPAQFTGGAAGLQARGFGVFVGLIGVVGLVL